MKIIESAKLKEISWLRHGFFTRQGGVSLAPYHSLNCSFTSADNHTQVAKNRQLVGEALNCRELVTLQQLHGNQMVSVDDDTDNSHCQGDAMVTDKAGIAMGVLTADCVPVLFADTSVPIVGVAHSGWRGALTGVTTAVIDELCRMGCSRGNLVAVIGPAIAQQSYQVDQAFLQTFKQQSTIDADNYFIQKNHQLYFDLPSYTAEKIRAAGVSQIENIGLDTYSDEDAFFSYRRSTHQGVQQYGRQISAIMLTG